MRTIALLAATTLAACSPSREPEPRASDSSAPAISAIPALPKVGSTETDSGPPVRVERITGAVRLRVDPAAGDQINALQPPVLQTADGRRLEFRGPAVTDDSAYFVGEVTLLVEAAALPLDGTLTTSYCRAGEKLCRSARRMLRVER